MTRQGTTAQDHRNLGQAVGRTIVLRYNWKQASDRDLYSDYSPRILQGCV